MQACLKKAGVKLEIITDFDMLVMVEKGFGGRMCHAIRRYEKANKTFIKNYDRNVQLSYLMYLDANNLYG